MADKTTVLIADDHAVMRSGLKLLLSSQPGIEVIAECGRHEEVIETLQRLRGEVNLVTLDLSMPGGTPAAMISHIARNYPQTRVVVLTMHDDPAHARLALAAGASGYVVKTAADTELLEAIRRVMRGEIYSGIAITGGPAGIGDKSVPPQPDPQGLAKQYTGTPLIDQLSDREREVFVLVAHGHTNQQIADRLFLSVKTIESYRARLMAKLGLKDRSELTRFALECGLLDGDRSV